MSIVGSTYWRAACISIDIAAMGGIYWRVAFIRWLIGVNTVCPKAPPPIGCVLKAHPINTDNIAHGMGSETDHLHIIMRIQ